MLTYFTTGDESRRGAIFNLLLIVLSLAGMVVLLINTPDGIASSPDTMQYLSAGRNLLHGRGYVQFSDKPLTLWTPLYATLIAAIYALEDLLNVDPNLLEVLRFLHAASFAVTIIAAGRLFADQFRSRAFALVAAASVLFSYPIVWVSAHAWSETHFVLICALFMWRLPHALEQKTWRAFVPVILLAALAPLQRYAGALLIPVGAAAIVPLMAGVPLRRRLQSAFAFGVVASLPFLVWTARTYHLTGTLFGRRTSSHRSLQTNLNQIYREIARWFVPERFMVGYYEAALIAVVVLGIGLALYARHYRRLDWRKWQTARWLPVALFVGGYIVFFAGSTTGFDLYIIDKRFLAPIYVGVMCLAFRAVESGATWLNRQTRRQAPGYLVLALAVIWLAHPVSEVRQQRSSLRNISKGAQHVYTGWDRSDLIRQLKAHPVEGTVYTNAPLHVLIHTSIAVHPAPAELDGWSKTIQNLAEQRGDVLLIWFDDFPPCDFAREYCVTTGYQIQDLAALVSVETVMSASDGHIYRLSAAPDP